MMDCGSDILYATVLRPNPPLPPKALRHILTGVVLFNVAFAGYFVAHGAWPIAPFLGLDVALLAWALRSSSLAAKKEEQLTLTRAALQILRRPEETETVLNPYWLAVDAARARGIGLRSHGKVTEIGRFLGPEARAALARELKDALWRAKNL